jgi:Sulfotransferase domain
MQPEADPEFIKSSLKSILDGYIAATDTPVAMLTPELCQLYPDVKVICTVREVGSRWKSWVSIAPTMSLMMASIIFLPVPAWRCIVTYIKAANKK